MVSSIWTSELSAGVFLVFAALAAMMSGFHDARPFTPTVWYVRPCRYVGNRRMSGPRRHVLKMPLAVLTRSHKTADALCCGTLHTLLRGGAGGSAASQRKQKEKDLLAGLAALLKAHAEEPKKTRTWAEDAADEAASQSRSVLKNTERNDSKLLGALRALVSKYSSPKRQDIPLFDALKSLVEEFSAEETPSPEMTRKVQFSRPIESSDLRRDNRQKQPDAAPFWPVQRPKQMKSASEPGDNSFLRRPPKIVDGFGKQLCNFHVFNQCLETGKLPDCVGALVKLENVQNFQELAKVHGLQDKPFALVIWNHKRDLSDAPTDAVRRWVLTERHGALCMPVIKLGTTMPNFPAEPKVNKTVEVKTEDLQTVRFSIRKELLFPPTG